MSLLIIGATGQQGRAVCDAALSAGLAARALVRRADTAAARALVERGVELVVGDLDDRQTLRSAFRGVSQMFSMQALDLSRATREIARGVAAAEAAAEAGVTHFVYSAALWTDRLTGVPHLDSKHAIRQRIAQLGLPATVLEPGSFMENLLHPQVLGGVRKGKLTTPVRCDLLQPLVAVGDVGPAAVWCFQHPQLSIGKAFPVYGEPLTPRQQADAIAAWLAKPIACGKLHPWLTRLFMGSDLARMFAFLQRDGGFPPASEHWPRTSLSSWLQQVRYAK